MLNRLSILFASILSLCIVAFLCMSYYIDDAEKKKQQKLMDGKSTSITSENDKRQPAHMKSDTPVVVEIIKTPEAELHLVGTIASNQERQNFLVALERNTKTSLIHDNLSIVKEGSPIEPIRMHAVLPILKSMKSGVISFWAKKVNITAVVDTQLENDLLEEEIALIKWQDVELAKKIIVMEDQRSTNVSGQIKKAQFCQNALAKKSQAFSIEFTKINGEEKLKENAVLQEFLTIILSCREHLIVIEGHYANANSHKVNQQRSERFATEVLKYFQTHSSQALNLVARGQGDTAPLYDNSTTMGKTMNRRIEFKVKEQ
ncbi:MAG: Unknown protein [uncultured Thiotrichaceae bacterium]|uniref:OmpA-like domain-containing protein n=1 Tax=uncultured Thiotrichaceae bacterium TaxID=298394 RepID=A0A6S6UG58_9GAMM|nr:MAG: Unknown protein [uncultured Thiotrichaceae bacterium]